MSPFLAEIDLYHPIQKGAANLWLRSALSGGSAFSLDYS
jgi:hypothetical protein